MGIQINGQTDTISASDGGLAVSGYELTGASNINVTGIVTATTLEANGGNVRMVDTNGRIYLQNGNTTNGAKIGVRGTSDTTNGYLAFETYGIEFARFDSSGNVLVGTTDGNFASGKGLKIADATAARIKLCDTDTGVGSTDGMDISFTGVDGYIENRENGALIIATNNTEVARLTNTGILSINETTPPVYRLITVRSNGTQSAGINLRNTAATDVCQLTIENATTSEDAGLYTKGNLKLYGNGTERALFNVDGICQIRTQSNNGFVCASQQSSGTSNFLFQGGHSSTGPGSYTPSFRVSTNGDITNTNNSLSAISDLKLKENIVDAKSQWDDIKGIRLRNYNFKAETGHETHTQLGVIAQELEAVCPNLVKETTDEDGETTKSVAYSVLYMKAVGALQEAMERIETLEAEVAALKAQ